ARVTATALPLPDSSATLVCTDPPYYNSVPYSDLSDFFYVWLRRTLSDIYPDLLSTQKAPQEDEIISSFSPGHVPHKTAAWFEGMIGQAFKELRRCLVPDGLAIVVFAHKSTAGWEAILQALVTAGWAVTGSW